MRVNIDIGVRNSFINPNSINNRLTQSDNSLIKGIKQERKDTSSISSRGKAFNLIESLMKQKQNIIKSKNDLMGRTLENGGSIESIKTQLESYDEQLKNIDEQIAKSITEETDKQEKSNMDNTNDKKSEDDLENEKLNNIVSLKNNLSHVNAVSSAKTKMEGQAKVWASEIETDGNKALESKKTKLSELENRINDISKTISSKLEGVNDHINTKNDTLEAKATEDKNDDLILREHENDNMSKDESTLSL
ncbi:hypothetical protein [Anaerovorax odorimutans]|uniref:hypothetical protein n=1 Tax=Anaerovorax odorimutans TaxID=109327 RepID=UPI00042A6EB1|nr:hypothetical protein [Anaerovorax odorimutans]